MMPRLIAAYIARLMPRNDADPMFEITRRREQEVYALVERRLAKVPYFAGDTFSGADIMMFCALSTMQFANKRGFDDTPRTLEYVTRVGERPAYRKAMDVADPGRPLLPD
jgi:glutathione S-transferase